MFYIQLKRIEFVVYFGKDVPLYAGTVLKISGNKELKGVKKPTILIATIHVKILLST